jgi:hypothetical protein
MKQEVGRLAINAAAVLALDSAISKGSGSVSAQQAVALT